MSRSYPKPTNKHQKHPKVHFRQYLYNASEPHEYMSIDSTSELEVELLENTEFMRQSFRSRARQMRNR